MTEIVTNRSKRLTGLVLVCLGAFGFSAKAIFVKLAYGLNQSVDVITLMALRMLFSLPFFLLVAFWNNKQYPTEQLTKKQWLAIILLGLMGYYVASYLDFLGLKYISAGLERIILYLYPTFVIILSAIIYRKPIKLKVWLALLLSYAGMILVFIERLSIDSDVWTGTSLVFASALVFSVFTMGSGVMTSQMGATRFTAYTMTVACTATLLHFLVQHRLMLANQSIDIYILTALMAIFSTVLPAFFMNAGILRVGAGSASIISTIGPVLTLGLAFWILEEPVGYQQLIGTFLILVSVYKMSSVKK